MNGYKTYIAGVCLILVGLAGAVLGFVMPGSEHGTDLNTAAEIILEGLTIMGFGLGFVGIRHAVQKLIDAVKT